MSIPPIVALEIGTTKVTALVGEVREDGHVIITGMGEHPSTGVRKGEIIDFDNAAVCVRSALAAAEESGKVTIRQVLVAVSGGHVQSLVNRGTVPVSDADGEITEEDVDEVMEVAKAVNLPAEREILHTVCQHFCIDNHERIVQPEGMEGARLSLDLLVLHGVRSRLHNTIRVVKSLSMDVQDVAFSGLCSALSVLTPEQKKSGVVVIDLGGGTTDYLAYSENVVAAAGVLGVGGDHVTNDVTMAFNIPISRAEQLKRESGSAVIDPAAEGQGVAIAAELGFSERMIEVEALHTVINARMDEILRMIKRRLDQDAILRHMGGGIVLTGGGAHLKGVTELAEKIFNLPCSTGVPRNVSGLAVPTEDPGYATASGLVQYGFKTVRGRNRIPQLPGWLGGLFGR